MAKNRERKSRQIGSVKSEMRHQIMQRYKGKDGKRPCSQSNRDNAMRACNQFCEWLRSAGYTNKQIQDNPRDAVAAWAEFLGRDMTAEETQHIQLRVKQSAYAPATIHTMIAGVCMGLGIDMTGIVPSGKADAKTKSSGLSVRAEQARAAEANQSIARFAEMVGGRRAAYARLTGKDITPDESGELCVVFRGDKGGKTQYQRIAPENVEAVAAYFLGKKPDELLFPGKIDKNMDLHGIRAEHARTEYERYRQICSTPAGREKMRKQLWARYHDPKIGNKGWLTAMREARETEAKGDRRAARKLYERAAAKEKAFAVEMKDGLYQLHGANRQAAILKDRPIEYDRLALCCVSVFALSHWRNEVTVKHYMI